MQLVFYRGGVLIYVCIQWAPRQLPGQGHAYMNLASRTRAVTKVVYLDDGHHHFQQRALDFGTSRSLRMGLA